LWAYGTTYLTRGGKVVGISKGEGRTLKYFRFSLPLDAEVKRGHPATSIPRRSAFRAAESIEAEGSARDAPNARPKAGLRADVVGRWWQKSLHLI